MPILAGLMNTQVSLRQVAVGLGALVLVMVLWRVSRPLRRLWWFGRWLPSSMGDMQRVLGRTRHATYVDGISNADRAGEEIHVKKARRGELVAWPICLTICCAGLFYIRTSLFPALLHSAVTPLHMAAVVLTLLLGFVCAGMAVMSIYYTLGALAREALFQTGFQRMAGARVLHPPAPPPPGPEVLQGEKGYGDAGPADVATAQNAYSRANPQEPNISFKN